MKRIVQSLIWVFVLLSLVACGETKHEPLEQTTALPTLELQTKPAVLASTAGLGLLYSDTRGVVYKSATQEVVLDTLAGTDHWLYADQSKLYAVWWLVDNTKTKQKSIMLSYSADGGNTFSKAIKLNAKEDALGEVSLVSDGGNQVAIAYADERSPGRFVYFNRSEDGGKTWLAEDQRLDNSLSTASVMSTEQQTLPFANSAKLGLINKQLVAVWQQADVIDSQPVMQILSKVSSDFGKTWGATQVVVKLPKPEAVELTAVSGDLGMYVILGLPDAGGMGLYELKDPNKPWMTIDTSQIVTKEAYSGLFKPVMHGKNLVIAFIEEKQGVKNKVKLATYLSESGAWAGLPLEVDKDKGHDMTRSSMPTIISTDKEVLVAWEDYRSLIPSIYANLSKDGGKTWLPQAKRLTTDGLTINNMPILAANKNQVWLFYITGQPKGENAKPAYAYQVFSIKNGLVELPNIELPIVSDEKRKEMLIERANKFWALREERKWEETWDYMEPLYRQRFNKKEWVFNQDRLSYSKTVVDEASIDIKGNFGFLKANVDVGLTNQVGREGLIEATPPKTQSVDMRWGWFYDNWYFVPDVVFGNHLQF